MRKTLVLLLACAASARAVVIARPAVPVEATRTAFRPAAHDWTLLDHALITAYAGTVLPNLGNVRWDEPESRAAAAPLLRSLEKRGITPAAFAEMPIPRRADEAFGAALEARAEMARSLREEAALVDASGRGAADLPRAVARLHLLTDLYSAYLTAADRESARAAYSRGYSKLTQQQAASIMAFSHRLALALGSSVEEDAVAARESAGLPERTGYFTPHKGAPEKRAEFVPPKPNPAVMAASTPLARWLMLGAPLLRRIPWVRDLPFVRGHFRLRGFEIPDEDAARLRAAVNPETAAFLTPNHPEFMTDWLIDKEISARFAPRMASWAAGEYVKTIVPWFWSRNNLVPNDGGRAAMDWSRDWALKGNVILIHPEGNVRWTGDKVHPLYPGTAEMALETAAAAKDRPVFIAPLVWKLVYQTDISPALHAEMDLIERALGLPADKDDRHPLEMRFFRLQTALLRRQMRRFGYDGGTVEDFFAAQEDFRAWLTADLLKRHAVPEAESLDRTLRRVEKAMAARKDEIPKKDYAHDRAILAEARRLGGFTRDAYNTPTLTQEQIFESLKRIRSKLMIAGLRGALERFFPKPLGPRVARVRVAEPIRVDAAPPGGMEAARDALSKRVHDALQKRLDELVAETAAETARHARPNPFFVPAP